VDLEITASTDCNQAASAAETRVSIVDSLAMPETTDVDFEPPRLADELFRLPELS